MPLHGSEGLADRLRPFAPCFTAAVRRHVPVLVAGALLAPGRRTVTAALRVTALERSASTIACSAPPTGRPGPWPTACSSCSSPPLVPEGPVVVGIDDTIELRRGTKIRARDIYRAPRALQPRPLRQGDGPRWPCLMVMAPMPWGGVRGLPFLSPSFRA